MQVALHSPRLCRFAACLRSYCPLCKRLFIFNYHSAFDHLPPLPVTMSHRVAGNISITFGREGMAVCRACAMCVLCVCVCFRECARWCVPIIAAETRFLPSSFIFKRLAGNDMSTQQNTSLLETHMHTQTQPCTSIFVGTPDWQNAFPDPAP